MSTTTPAEEALADAWREHWGRLLALLAARFRRLDLAEDALADAFEAAARRWPLDGVPDNPPGWLLTTARRRALDRIRAEAVAARKEPLLLVDAELAQESPGDSLLIPDERLRLVLLCAHPALSLESSSALALRLVIGLPVTEIARLFLAQDTAIAARITRAKKRIVASGMPLALPGPGRLGGRVGRVADVAYLAFTAGYVPGPGAALLRTDLAGEAIRLLEVTRDLAGPDPVLDATLALMLLQHSRRAARVTPDGQDLVLLPDQDRSSWRHEEIARALQLLAPLVGRPLAGLSRHRLLEALVALEHATAARAEDTRWDRIAAHYAELESMTGSPVVRLNRAVAVGELDGPAAGLTLLDGLEEALPGSHRLPAVRAELLGRAGEVQAARTAYELAIQRCGNDVERRHLKARLSSLA